MPVHGVMTSSTGDRARLLQAIDGYRAQGLPFRIEDAGAHVLQVLTQLSRRMVETPAPIRGRRRAAAKRSSRLAPHGCSTRRCRRRACAACTRSG